MQDEAQNLQCMIAHSRAVFAPHFVSNKPELLEKALLMFERKATGKLALDKDWQYSLLIDDLIAHAHDLTPIYRGTRTQRTSRVYGFPLFWVG